MKKQFLWAALAATTLFYTSCNNEEPNQKSDETEVTFVIEGVDSRTATTGSAGNYTTVFKNDDKVGIYAKGGSNTENALFTYSNGTLTGNISYKEGTETTFYAYYPYQDPAAQFTVGNQSTGIDKYDLMTASATITKGNTVSLTFAHQLAMVEVQIVGSIGEKATSLTMKNIKPTVSYNGATGQIGEASGDPVDIQMWRIDENSNTYVALVPAQTIAANAETFITEIDTKAYVFKPSKEVSLTANNIARYKVTIGEGQAEMTTVSTINFTNWVASTLDSDTFIAEEVKEPAIELISVADFSNATLGTRVGGISSMTNLGWAQVGAEDNATITLGNGTLTLKAEKAGSSWYNRSVLFRSKSITDGKTQFTLNFTVKSDKTEGNSDLQLAVMLPETGSNTWFKLGNNTSAAYCTVSNTELNKTYSIDLSSASATADYKNGIILLFTPKAIDGVTYTITNVTLVETKE